MCYGLRRYALGRSTGASLAAGLSAMHRTLAPAGEPTKHHSRDSLWRIVFSIYCPVLAFSVHKEIYCLMFILDFLNKNDGAITTIATVVLVGITLYYVLETRKMRLTSQEMLKNANIPEIQVSLLKKSKSLGHFRIPHLELCIQNIGTGFAYDVKFAGTFTSFHPEASDKVLREYEIIKNGISYLGPGKGYQLFLPFEITKNVPKDPLSIDVTYKDSANAPYDKTFHLDFTKAEGYTQIGDPSIDSIASSLRGIYDILFSRFPRR